jgi:hypothetical protein
MPGEEFSGERMLYYLAFGVLFSVGGLVLIILLANQGSGITIVPEGLEEYIFVKRFTDDCFAYQDQDILRKYPEYIDWNKFNQESIEECYSSHADDLAFRLTLIRNEIGAPAPVSKNPVTTTNWKERAEKIITKEVLVYDNKIIYTGELKIEMENV